MKLYLRSNRGGTLIVALITISIFSLVIAAFYETLTPKYRSISQGVSWQEALHGAESGADYGLRLLNQFASTTKDPDAYDWAGNQWSYSDASYVTNGERTLNSGSLPVLGGPNNVAVTGLAVDVYTRDSAAPYTPWFRIRSTARADVSVRDSRHDLEKGMVPAPQHEVRQAQMAMSGYVRSTIDHLNSSMRTDPVILDGEGLELAPHRQA